MLDITAQCSKPPPAVTATANIDLLLMLQARKVLVKRRELGEGTRAQAACVCEAVPRTLRGVIGDDLPVRWVVVVVPCRDHARWVGYEVVGVESSDSHVDVGPGNTRWAASFLAVAYKSGIGDKAAPTSTTFEVLGLVDGRLEVL